MFNEEVITPYVIVNKTDMAVIIKRFIDKQKQDKNKHILLGQHKAEKTIVDKYVLEQGQITEYMIDYKNHKLRQYSNQNHYKNSDNEIDLLQIERDPVIDNLQNNYI